MPRFLVTVQMLCRQSFTIDAADEEEARLTFGDGTYGEMEHDEPEIIAVEKVPADDLFA